MKNERAVAYVARQYFFEDLGGIILVAFVAKQLGELSTFAILSLVGNIGMEQRWEDLQAVSAQEAKDLVNHANSQVHAMENKAFVQMYRS